MLLIGVYYPVFIVSNELYNRNIYKYGRRYCMLVGLVIACSALFMQEIIGHYIGGDQASRLEGIPNAILYAPYYSIAHLT
jgi:hypothetical protein